VNQTHKWISWITSGDKKKWKEATLALGGLSYDSDVDITSLISALDSDVDDVVFWCVGALGSLGDRSVDAIDRLIVLTDSEYLGVRQASIYALSRIAPNRADLNDIFVRKLSDSSEFVVCDVLSAFIKMNTVGKKEINAIKQCLTHPSEHVAFQAEVALRNIMINSRDA
jgi:hypothetical protein